MSHSLLHSLSKGLVLGCLLLPLAVQAQDQQANADAAAAEAGAEQPLPSATGTQVYKSVDKDGKTVFTDTPPKDRPADVVTVKPSNRISLPSGDRGETGEGENKAASKYTSLIVTSPQNDEYFGQETMVITLSASAQPGMQEGHTAQLYYDGKPVGDSSLFYTVDEPERGTHTVVAKIFNERGKVLIESEPVQFHVRRTSVLNQHKPQPAGANNSPSGGTGGTNTTAAPPPAGGFGSAKGFGGSGGSSGGKAAGGAGGAGSGKAAGGAGGAAPRPGR
ncbi:MAG: DUF4124 domain-containing protein [Pseudomonadales bacterium]